MMGVAASWDGHGGGYSGLLDETRSDSCKTTARLGTVHM